jgi:cyclic-di-GMP-binding protein
MIFAPRWITCSPDPDVPSFDVVSEIDAHELTNAVDQANRELAQRYDFKGTPAVFELLETTVTMVAEAEFQLKQMLDILKQRLAARHIDIGCAEIGDPEINLATARQKVTLKQGIDQTLSKDIVKRLKESGLKVQVQIQGDKLRITGKKKDDLQTAIAFLRGAGIKMPLQFENFRD